MKDLCIYLITHNRGELIKDTIQSLIDQDCSDFKVIISDNSSNDETRRIIERMNLPINFEYLKRSGLLSANEHINTIISEVSTKFFVIFHDDDIMLPHFVSTLYKFIEKSSYIAVGGNAYKMFGAEKSKKTFISTAANVEVDNIGSLVNSYKTGQISPFPCYIYNRELIEKEKYGNEAGKYSDVVWLMKLLWRGLFLWISEPIMYYRIHIGQYSPTIDDQAMEKLIKCFEDYSKTNRDLEMVKKYSINYKYSMGIKTGMFDLEYLKNNSKFNYYPKAIIRLCLKKVIR